MRDRVQREPTVYIVDDDAAMRDSLSLMLGLLGYRTASYQSAEDFLSAFRDDWTGCIVADLKLPGVNGIELQAELRARGGTLPFVIITGHGDVASARAAFQSEALDFLEKPFDDETLRAAIEKGLEREDQRTAKANEQNSQAARLAKLTRRELEVLQLIGEGLHAKQIASSLGISARTVEVYKARIMSKLDGRNIADLVRFALAAQKHI